MKIYNFIVIITLTAFIYSCAPNSSINQRPKNVILLIGDGAGLSQISSAYYFKTTKVNYSRFKTIGLIKTSSSEEDITDSAAAATAFASGVKTNNGAIGMVHDTVSVKNITELVSPKGIKTGLVATSSITHATPACFFAHIPNRYMYDEIAAQLPSSGIDFFAAGGLEFFNKRKDGKNILYDLNQNGFTVDTLGLNDFSSISNNSKLAFLLAPDAMPQMLEGRGDFLTDATQLGLQFLNKDREGFFMMIEGSQIDWGGHANNTEFLVSEFLDFDNAIGTALDFAENDGNTLVIVTADHETGGFTLSAKTVLQPDGSTKKDYNQIEGSFSTSGHSATLIPVFAYGPGSEEFSGVYDNTEIFHKIIKMTNWSQDK